MNKPTKMLDRSAELHTVIESYLQQRTSEKPLSPEELIGRYPHLMPQLGETLRRLQLIDAAQQSVQGEPAAEALPPRRLGRFELLECVGVGGFGAVWKSIDRQLDRVVAIKLPREHLGGAHLDNFLREARIVARLKHPNIVHVYEVGTENETVFIVSDFIDGVPLDVWATEHQPSYTQIAELCQKLAEAVETAHRAGIVHRDLKPANILMNQAGEPAITDFGLAKQHSAEATITLDGRILGTPAYMSPEQADGRSAEADGRSDIYSLGVILYELLTGEPPFRGPTATLIHRVVHDDPIAPRKLHSDIPRDLETICLKCLEKEPTARYPSAQDVAAEFGRYLRGQPILARPVGRLQQLLRWSVRNPLVATLSLVAVLSFFSMVVAGWWFYFDERKDRRELIDALEQEDYMRQAFLQTQEFQHLRESLEQTAHDPALIDLMTEISQDKQFASLSRQLLSRGVQQRSTEWLAKQNELIRHSQRVALQAWIDDIARTSDNRVFAWFVLDDRGTQIARNPTDTAIGRNYAWRTYFHGGTRDFHDYADYLRAADGLPPRIAQTYLSRGLFTEVTNRFVVVISTPIVAESNERFLGVLGLMVELRAVHQEPRRQD